MQLPRRRFLHFAAGAAALPALPRIAHADAYPSRPVRMLVGSTPGAAPDVVARLFGQWLAERLGQPFVIENRPAGGGNLAAEPVVRAPPDGYMLLVFSASNAIDTTLLDTLNFDLGARHRAGRRHDRSADAALGQPVVPGQNAARVHRLRQSQSGQGQYRHAAGRQSAICQRRAARNDDGYETCRHSLSRRSRRR